MKLRLFMTAVLAVMLSHSIIFAADNKTEGGKLSESIEQKLLNAGFSPTRNYLAATGQDVFAFNIVLTFSATQNQAELLAKPATEDSRTTLIMDFTQEDFFNSQNPLMTFLQYLHTKKLSYTVIVVITALDNYIPGGNNLIKGTDIFTQSIDDPDHAAAVVIRLDKNEKNLITIGSAHNSTPKWLARRIYTAFKDSGTNIEFQHLFLSLYRLGIYPENSYMASYMRLFIPTVGLTLSEKTSYKPLTTFIDQYRIPGTENWDQHYALIPFPNHPVWIGERVFVIVFLIFSACILLIVCGFSFTGSKRAQYKTDFIRAWYMIPVTILVSTCSLLLGQQICLLLPMIQNMSYPVQFGIKILFSAGVISILFIIQEQLRLPVAPFIYGYLLSLMAIANIFIFSALDLSLFVLFTTEYILIAIARSTTRIIPLLFSVVIMVLPFLPYLFSFLNDTNTLIRRQLVFSSLQGNILLSCGLFPFQIMWLRMLVRLNLFGKHHQLHIKQIIFRTLISTLSLLAAAGFLIFSVSQLLNRSSLADKNAADQTLPIQYIDNSKTPLFSVKITDSTYLGMTTRHLYLNSQKQAVRYTISIFSEGKTPVYDSLYDYTIDDRSQTADFSLPDIPPRSVTIDYASNSSVSSTISVTGYYKTENPLIFNRETYSITTPPTKSAGI